jgi:hypothetical protein
MSNSEGATPHSPSAANDPVPALAGLYQGEKTDATGIFNTAMAMMGVAVAYLIGAIPFVSKISEGPIPWVFLILLPMPLWIVIAFHSLITLNAMSHGVSVRIIENALFESSGLRGKVKRNLVGSAAGDKIMDITQAKTVHKLTTVFVYGGVAVLVLLFTAYALYSAMGLIEKGDIRFLQAGVVWTAAVMYILVAIMVLRSWIVGLSMINEGRGEIPDYGEDAGPGEA